MGEIKEYKGLTGKQVLVNVPNGYRFVQNGLKVELVRKSRDKWEGKDSGVNGFFVTHKSKVIAQRCRPRTEADRKVFHKKSQAIASLALAMLSQQLADFNEGWEPDWTNEGLDKYCIYRSIGRGGDRFNIFNSDSSYHFLVFRTEEDAEEFLATNIKQIELAKDFI